MHMATAPSHAANLTSFSLYIKLQKEGVADFNLGYGNTHSYREDKPADRPVADTNLVMLPLSIFAVWNFFAGVLSPSKTKNAPDRRRARPKSPIAM